MVGAFGAVPDAAQVEAQCQRRGDHVVVRWSQKTPPCKGETWLAPLQERSTVNNLPKAVYRQKENVFIYRPTSRVT
jgi:hypothetical protein